MFIELYQSLISLSQDNQMEISRDNAKRFVNWSLKDIANEYDFEFLRGSLSFNASADGVYSLDRYTQPSSQVTLYAICESSADNDVYIEARGKYLQNPTVATASNYQSTAFGWNASAAATASGAIQLSYIDGFTKPITSGSVFITTGSGNVLVTLGATETWVSNDIRKINAVTDSTNNQIAQNFDWNNQTKANPDNSVDGSMAGYDLDYQSQIRVFNCDTTRTYNVYYQRTPKYLIKDNDLTEFPYSFYQDIVNYAYNRYSLRWQDEADAWSGIQFAEKLKQDIIKKWTIGKDRKDQQVLPAWYKRRV